MASGSGLILIAVYLLGVAYQGNVKKLGAELVTDKAFVPWAFSVAVLYMLMKNKSLGNAGGELFALASLGFLFSVGDKIFPAINSFLAGSKP